MTSDYFLIFDNHWRVRNPPGRTRPKTRQDQQGQRKILLHLEEITSKCVAVALVNPVETKKGSAFTQPHRIREL